MSAIVDGSQPHIQSPLRFGQDRFMRLDYSQARHRDMPEKSGQLNSGNKQSPTKQVNRTMFLESIFDDDEA